MTEKTHTRKRRTGQGARETAHAALAERTLDFVALVGLLTAVTAVFLLAGPDAFAAVTSVGTGLFAAWRGHRRQT
ncbi:hypothetical protein ACFY4I_07835 [Streptomyces scabiei]|uniref:hypothetical protein n=1 Tax=Streptomyces scabiei TaxID=1930 RepID=UPI0036BDE350